MAYIAVSFVGARHCAAEARTCESWAFVGTPRLATLLDSDEECRPDHFEHATEALRPSERLDATHGLRDK